MNQKEFNKQVREAAKEMLKKKAPTKPDTQFIKGAAFAWELLKSARDAIYYEEVLRQDVCDRYKVEQPEQWQLSLIEETARKMARLSRMEAQVEKDGDTLKEQDKNMNYHIVNHPLQITMKELERTIGMQREHLGLSAKSTKKMESPKRGADNKDKLLDALSEINDV